MVGEHPSSVEVRSWGLLEDEGERMLARVTAIPVRARNTVNLRFPWQWRSTKG